jgi:hypothetical protein
MSITHFILVGPLWLIRTLIPFNGIDGGAESQLSHDPDIVEAEHGGFAFVHFCNSTLYDVEYDSTNETITRSVGTLSNASVSTIFVRSL